MSEPNVPRPDPRIIQQLLDDAMPVAQALHALMREMDLDLMTFIAACHLADKIAILYWRSGDGNDCSTLDVDAQKVRDAVDQLKFSVLSQRPAEPGTPGHVTSVTILDHSLTTPFKPGEPN